MPASQVGVLGSVLLFVVVPGVALGAAIALSAYEVYRIGERKLLLVIAILALMLQHQVLEAFAFWQTGDAVAEGFGEVFETGANLIAAGSVYYVLRFARRERRLLRELERSEQQYRTLIEEAPVPVLLHGTDEIRYANDAAVELLDAHDRTAVTGRGLPELVTGTDERDVREAVLTDGGSDAVESRLRTLDGETRHAILTGAPADYEGEEIRQIAVQDVTERRRRERELQESERRFQLIAEHIDEIIYLAKADFSEILYINSVYEEIYGRSVAELSENPRAFVEAAHPDDRQRYEADVERLIDDVESGDPQAVYEGEYRIVRDGDVRWVTVTRFPVENEDGTVDRIVGRVQDVTERRELERTYRELFENVSDGLVVHEPDSGEILDVNERFCEMNGYEREELVGETIGLLSPDDETDSYERAKEKIRRARDEGPQLFEWRNQRADGETFPVEVHLTHAELRGEHRVVASVRDISERRETEARFQTIVERIDAGVMLVAEGESEPEYLNPVYEEITGLPLEDLYDPETFIEHVHPEDREGYVTDVGAMIDDILAGEPDDRYEFEFRFERPDGETRWFHWTGYPLLEEDNDYRYVGLTTDVTERRERQQRVRENERTYRELFNKSSAAITVHDPATEEMVGVNDTMCELLGYDRETILERDVDGVSATEEGYSMDRGADIIERVMESGESEEFEWLLEDADGERHWMLVTGSPVTINGERRFLATSQEITERKRRAREYEQIFEGVNDAIAVHDPETGEMLAVNERLCEITGYDRDTLAEIGATGLTVATDEFAPARVPEIIDRVMDGEDVEPYEQAIETSDGQRRWLEVNPTRAVIDGEERFLAISRDVTARRERQQRLETERDRRAKLFENTPDPIMAVEFEDDRPHITEVNPSFEEAFGFDAESVADRPIAEVIVPEEEREGYEEIRQHALSGESVETEVRRETADGVRDFLLRVLPFESGGDRHAYVWYTDITERKRREQRLEVFNRVLRHNLRNQLDVIKSHAEILADRTAEEHADRIIASADRLAAMGDRARTIDRFMSRERRETEIDLSAVVRETLDAVDGSDAGVTATVDLPDRAPLVTDDEAVTTVLESALDNAVGYADSSVAVTVAAVDDGYTVTIDDDGPGIPSGELTPLDTGTETDLEHGRGLGLWQLKWGVNKLGGELSFDTSQGTTVRITLPDLRARADGT